ncbi:MAG: hypothetical protein ACPGUX_02400, partial [Halocynthiibacter sp.]
MQWAASFGKSDKRQFALMQGAAGVRRHLYPVFYKENMPNRVNNSGIQKMAGLKTLIKPIVA